MVRMLSVHEIQSLGFEWPRHALIVEYCVVEKDKVDLLKTIESMRSSRAFYKQQLSAAFAFKSQTGADYSDFTDRFDDYARMERELSVALSYLEEIFEAATARTRFSR